MNGTSDRLVADYLSALRKALADLPPESRREVLEDIDEHIAEAQLEDGSDELSTRNVLDRLGAPERIAEDARERFGVRRRTSGWREIAAVILLPIGGVILPLIGWIIGLILLWSSEVWSTREKWLGTLVIPGGLMIPVWLMFFVGSSAGGEICEQPLFEPSTDRVLTPERCTSVGGSGSSPALGIALVALLMIAPIAVSILLARRMKKPAVAAV